MGRLHRPGRPDLILHKHRLTRRYLNLDAEGHAYRYYPPKESDLNSDGLYRRYPNLVDAVDHLELHLLLWMAGSDFLDQDLGIAWKHRWDHPDVIAWYAQRCCLETPALAGTRDEF